MGTRTFKMLSFLLAYPERILLDHHGDILAALREEKVVPKENIKGIEVLVDHLSSIDLLSAQEEYVALFDRTPSLSLHLFEHVYGESRERGQAMVDLQGLYLQEGLEIDARETPDYFPLFLEYLSILPFEEAQQCLGEVVNVVSVLKSRLSKRESPYAHVLEACEKLSRIKPDLKMVKKAMQLADGSPISEEEIDEAWEETPAFADNCGAEASSGGCPAAQDLVNKITEGLEINGDAK